MTALQLAAAHCANWQAGSCLGIRLNDDLTARSLVKNAKCVLVTRGVRCPYFEDTVMPMGRADWPGLRSPLQHREFDEVIAGYQRAGNVPSGKNGRRKAVLRRFDRLETKTTQS